MWDKPCLNFKLTWSRHQLLTPIMIIIILNGSLFNITLELSKINHLSSFKYIQKCAINFTKTGRDPEITARYEATCVINELREVLVLFYHDN